MSTDGSAFISLVNYNLPAIQAYPVQGAAGSLLYSSAGMTPYDPTKSKGTAVESAPQLQVIALDNDTSFSGGSMVSQQANGYSSHKSKMASSQANTGSHSSISCASLDDCPLSQTSHTHPGPITAELQTQVSVVVTESLDGNPDSELRSSMERTSIEHTAVSDLAGMLRETVTGATAAMPAMQHQPDDCEENIKEIQIETEDDPSHLFWVPFHRHPEIAPNEYNKWLTKHGVDTTDETGSRLMARKPSVSRRKSVLSEQYKPEDDEDEDEDEETEDLQNAPSSRRKQPSPITIPRLSGARDTAEPDFLSGVFSVPLEQMGEPPLKMKTSLRRAVSHSAPETIPQDDGDISSQDLATAKRAGGLGKGGMSLLRRSARTKIRRDSTASMEIHNDASRLRQSVDENGEYPAVTLVDPGPLPLPSSLPSEAVHVEDISTSLQNAQDESRDDTDAMAQPVPRPFKRFVSTLRDPSKPTITTYIEPQLLEQQRRELDGPNPVPLAVPHGFDQLRSVPTAGDQTPAQDRLKSVVTSSVTYPIPPPKKLAHNLLQHPASQPAPAPPRVSQSTPPAAMGPSIVNKKVGPVDNTSPGLPTSTTSSKKWLWFKSKDKNGDKAPENGQRTLQQTPNGAHPQEDGQQQVVTKKQSTLSLLFSRNGKTVAASKVQTTTTSTATGRHSGQMVPDIEYENDPSRMPIHIERAIYRMSHVKLANPRRPLHDQVLISNMMFWYLGVIQQQQQQQQELLLQQQQLEQQDQQQSPPPPQAQQQHPKQQNTQLSQEEEAIHARGRDVSPDLVNGNVDKGSFIEEKSLYDPLTVTSEPRIAGSDQVVPLQDSNSHARLPNKNALENSQLTQPLSRGDSDYDEESMMGGGYIGDFDWKVTAEDVKEESSDLRKDSASSLYLNTGPPPVASAVSVHTHPSGSRSQDSLSIS